MACSVFEGIEISRHRCVTMRYEIDGKFNAIPVLTTNDFKKEHILDREFQAKGWFYERCMSLIPYPKEKWSEIKARLVFTDVSHLEW